MKALILKEFLMLKKGSFTILLLIVAFGVAGLFGNPSILLMIPFFVSTLQYGFINQDEQSRWKQYSLTLPYGRSKIISSKYVTMAILTAISAVVVMLFYIIYAIINNATLTFNGALAYMILALVTGLIYPTFILPIAFRFSSEKGRLCFALIGGLSGAMAGMFMSILSDKDINKIFVDFSESANIFPYTALGVVAVLFALSWLISIKIYKKRDL